VPVIIKLDTGETYMLDRGLYVSKVAETINEARGKGQLIPFQNNDTPSREIFIDPDHVTSIKHDGYNY
jgi:hypothetical protein